MGTKWKKKKKQKGHLGLMLKRLLDAVKKSGILVERSGAAVGTSLSLSTAVCTLRKSQSKTEAVSQP